MAGSFNKVIIMGNVVADPELKTTGSGIQVTTLRVAVGRRFTRQGEEPVTDFFNVVCWRQQAEFAVKYFSKGTPIHICGTLQNRTWTDQNGQNRISTDIIADEITFAGSKSSGSAQQGGTYYGADSQGSSPAPRSEGTTTAAANFEELATEDDLPF